MSLCFWVCIFSRIKHKKGQEKLEISTYVYMTYKTHNLMYLYIVVLYKIL